MSIESKLQSLFQDIAASAELMIKDSSAYYKQFSFLPPVIGVGDGRMIYHGKKGADAIVRISRAIRENSRELQAALSERDMIKLTSTSLGELIAEASDASVREFSLPSDAAAFKRGLRQRIENKLSELDIRRTHLFGAWVFRETAVDSVTIGPVRFLPRENWLREARESGLLTEARASRISKIWQGSRLRKRKHRVLDDLMEAHVVDSVGPCPWICTVDLRGHSAARSREKAVIAARIALAAIALSWQAPSASARETGLLFDLGPPRSRVTVAYDGADFVGGKAENLLRLGRHLAADDVRGFIARAAARFETVGAALDTFLAVEPQSRKTKLELMLCRSLTWFGEACREPLDFLAIVKFAAALDTLAKGKQAGGICDLVRNRFSINDMGVSFLTDGTSARGLVEEIYNTGRSQIVHGSRPSLVEDLEGLRTKAELLATMALRACIEWLRNYSGPDDENAYRMP